jgi:1,2-diacylglycerol 3-beta-glucosyltransferase
MLSLVELLVGLVVLYVVVVSCYLMLVTVSAYSFRKRVGSCYTYPKLAVVVPAHNEELSITSTIDSIKRSNYPSSDFEVIVIADNCEDSTADLARKAGAIVFERKEAVNRGKGQALEWFFTSHQADYKAFAGVVVMDADTVMDECFLKGVAESFSDSEVQVVQGFDGVLKAERNWWTALACIAFCAINHVRPAGVNRIGGSAGLRGNGMAFRTEVMLKFGWHAQSVVEDFEHSLFLLTNGIIVHYNPDAVVYAEMPVNRKQAEVQRERWERSRIKICRQYIPKLICSLIKSPRMYFGWALIDLVTPPLSILVVGQLALVAFSALLWHSGVLVSGFCLFATFFYVASGLILRKVSVAIWLYLLLAPFFIIWKMSLYAKMSFGRKAILWNRTPRQ